MRIRAARERLGWSRETLAFHSNVSWSAIAQAESGRRRNLRPGTLDALATALGLTIDYLVRGVPPGEVMFEHKALVYGAETDLVETAGPFLAAAVERSEAALAVTTVENTDLLRDYLGAAAASVEFVDSLTWYRTPAGALDAYRTFAESKVEEGAPWVRIVGEPIWSGRGEDEVRLWTRYEALLNLVFSRSPVALLCAYDRRTASEDVLEQARMTHPGPDYADPALFLLEPRD